MMRLYSVHWHLNKLLESLSEYVVETYPNARDCEGPSALFFRGKQEILRNLQEAHSLSPPPPSPFLKEKRFDFSSSRFPVTCYGQFALAVCKELNVCMQLENFVCL